MQAMGWEYVNRIRGWYTKRPTDGIWKILILL